MVIKMEIRAFSEEYRDDLIFMVLQAKDALGRRPGINEDLLDIKANYIDRGDMSKPLSYMRKKPKPTGTGRRRTPSITG